MITALATPAAGRVILDGNNTKIKIQSTNGQGFYFRAKIFINGIEFDEQGWSREDDFTATQDINKLYNAYFIPALTTLFTNSLTQQTHLIRSVAITVNEYNIATGAQVDTITLPAFYILYNTKPVAFSDNGKVTLLGIDATAMAMPANGNISIPFYVNAANEAVTVTVKTNTGATVNTMAIAAFTGKRVYLYQYNLTLAGLSYSVLYLTATITVGTTRQTITYRINRLPSNPIKEIVFCNNFGYYIYAYLDGELSISNALTPNTYVRKDGFEVANEITEEATYTLNSGSLTNAEKPIINQIANSLDVRIWQANGGTSTRGTYVPVTPDTKKNLEYQDRTHLYNTALSFTRKKGTAVDNTGMITVAGTYPNIYITGSSVAGHQFTINFVFNNGFTAPLLVVQYRPVNSTFWTGIPVNGVSPVVGTISPGDYYMRLAEYGNLQNVSNEINVTIL